MEKKGGVIEINKKGKTKKYLSIIVLVILLALAVYYIINHLEDFKQLKLVKPIYFIPLILMSLLASFNNGLVTKYLLEPFKIKLRFKEYFGLSVMTSFGNYITPFRGGMAARAVYLKDKYNFSFSHFFSTLSASYVIIFFVAGFLGLISTTYLYYVYNIFNWIVFLIFLGFFLSMLLIMIISPRIPETRYRFVNYFIRIINGWDNIRKQKKILLVVTLVSIFNILFSVIGTMLVYNIIGIKIPFFQALFLSCIGSLVILISITPGGLGISEAVGVFSALIINITPAQSLTAAIIGRVIGIIIIFTLGPIFSYILMNSNSKENSEKSQPNSRKERD